MVQKTFRRFYVKILFIAPQPFFRDRGTPIRTMRQLEELSRMGHETDLLCYPFGTSINLPGVHIVRIPRPPLIRDVPVGPSLAKIPLDALLFCYALRMCMKKKYDLIQAVEESAFFAVWFKKNYNTMLVYNMDSYISDHLHYSGFTKSKLLLRFARYMERKAMYNADFVITVGAALSEVVHNIAPATKIIQLEDTTPSKTFVEDIDGAKRLREQFGLSEKIPVAVYTGNFSPYQGVELLIQSAGIIAKHQPEVKIIIVGGTPNDIAMFQKLARREGAEKICIFVSNRPISEMPAFMTLANILVSPRIAGTNPPLKIYPYMQSGRVIVVTRLPVHTQILDDTCAILADPIPEKFAEAILLALNNPSMRVTLGQEAQRRFEKYYRQEIFYNKIRSMYQQIETTLSQKRCG